MKAAGATAEVQATYPSSAVTTLPTMVATSAMAPFPVSPHASVCGGGSDGVCVCGSVCVWGGGGQKLLALAPLCCAGHTRRRRKPR
jgi:hypothetical protein